MHPLPIIALLERPGDSLFDALLRIIGLVTLAWVFFVGLKAIIAKYTAPAPTGATPPPAEATPPPAGATVPQPPAEEIAPEILAVIAAAVATLAGPARRIVSIKSESSHWARAGRQAILTSHRIR